MDSFATASTGPTRQELTESRAAVAEASSGQPGFWSSPPESDIETFGLQKGRPYQINSPQDFKPGDRKRAKQQLIPTQDKKDHIRSRLGKHVAPALPESDVAEDSYKDTGGTFMDRVVGEIMNYQSLNNANPKFADLSSAVKSKLKSLGEIKAKQIYQQALKQAAELSGQQGVAEAGESKPKAAPKRQKKDKPLDYEKLAAFFNQYAPDRNITKAFNQHVQNQKDKDNQDVTEGGRPDVMRHRGDTTIRVVKRGGRPIGEIGTDAEASPGNGAYYVKLYDGSYDAVGFDTAEEALAELKAAISEGRLTEFAPSDSGGDDGDDGFDEDTLRKLAAQWFAGDEDPQVERLLAAAGWEIGQDEGYDDEPGVFVVQSGDADGRSYISWPASELRSDVAEQQVDELSPKTLGSYIKKSSADAAERQGEVSGRNQFGKGAEFAVKAFYGDQIQPNPTRTDPRIAKRQAGVDQAVDRLTAEDVAPAFKPGDRVMYLTGFATVVAQDGDAYGIRIDGKPGTQMVPADQIRKPSYDESVAESIDPVEQLRADIRRFAL
jgi:hypothetical protein